MVGLVLVSHSRALALAVRELVTAMSGPKLAIAIAAGTGPDRAELGTDAMEILEGINTVMSEEGVLVLLDIGSAILSAETALEFLDGAQRNKVRLCGAPFVEGAVAAGVLAAMGSELDDVAAEAVRALRHKTEHLDPAAGVGDESQPAGVVTHDDSFLAVRVVVKNPHGLHARPAAQFVREASRHDCEIFVRNLTNGRGPASARSMSGLASIEILQGHEIELSARGPQAQTALEALQAEIQAGLGEEVGPSPVPTAIKTPTSIAGPPSTSPVAVSAGIAIGPLFFAETGDVEVPPHKISDPRKEKERLRRAIATAKAELARDEMSLRHSLGQEKLRSFVHRRLSSKIPRCSKLRKRRSREIMKMPRSPGSGLTRLPQEHTWASATNICDNARRMFRTWDTAFSRPWEFNDEKFPACLNPESLSLRI